MLHLNSVIFASPKCTYSTSSLFKTLIYIPGNVGLIPCLYLENENSANQGKLMIYFHGNAEDLGSTFQQLQVIRDVLGVRVLAMEYRGYGLYQQEKSSDGLLIDALTVYDYITKEFEIPQEDIILCGRSIGGTPACWIASQRQPSLLILICPYRTLQEAAKAIVGWFLGSLLLNRFDNEEMIRKVVAPIMIVHGQRDTMIPYQQSQALISSCEQSKGTCLVLPPDMGHNNFCVQEDLVIPLVGFLSQLNQSLKASDARKSSSWLKEIYFYPDQQIIEWEKRTFKGQSEVWALAAKFRPDDASSKAC